MPNGTYSAQYSTLDNDGNIINSTAYRAAVLYDAYMLTGIEEYKLDAKEHVDFILSYQQDDGSWFYQVLDDNKQTHIDNFHTCFVLKNLYYIYNITKEKRIKDALILGLHYYKNNLLTEKYTPIHYSFRGLPRFRKVELYDYAEAIYLFILFKSINKDSFEIAKNMAEQIISNWQLKDGHFITRITTLNSKHKVPYHRWAQSQIFNTLTLLYKEKENEKNIIHT